MTRGSKNQHGHVPQPIEHKFLSCSQKISKKESKNKNQKNKSSKPPNSEECVEDVTCSICMENPHNAVLLQCSSRRKGCRPYMCATSHRYANCLDRYKKAYADLTRMVCPLCRGQVKSWSVDASARQIFDSRKRSCMQEDCPFMGTYRDLRKHTREAHPLAHADAVDPMLEAKWKRMEHETERNDAMSVVMSSVQGEVVVIGDYAVEFVSDNDNSAGEEGIRTYIRRGAPDIPFPEQDFEASRNVSSLNARLRRLQQDHFHRFGHPSAGSSESVHGPLNDESSSVSSSRNGRIVLGRSGRRARRRQNKNRQ